MTVRTRSVMTIKTKEDIIETIEYAIKDIENGMEEHGIAELESLVKQIKDPKMMTVDLKKQYDWKTDYDWTDLQDHPCYDEIKDPFIKEKRRQANIQSDNIDLEALGWKKV